MARQMLMGKQLSSQEIDMMEGNNYSSDQGLLNPVGMLNKGSGKTLMPDTQRSANEPPTESGTSISIFNSNLNLLRK
jgi:hypothetical protein